MKVIKKNLLILTFTTLLMLMLDKGINAVSDKFKFVLDTIGIPRYNIYGEEINEEIYYTYNLFVYSSPTNVANLTSEQRFKKVDSLGKWTQGGGSYKNYGVRGEYYVLGRSYSGSLIYNVYFPVDSIPEVTPDRWNFISLTGALETWNNRSLYKYEEQLEYMKNADLLFDEINYSTRTTNPYNLISYNLSANKIGLNKVFLNTCATWKTNGVVKVYRKDNKGRKKYAIFSTNPMAANANIKSQLKVDDNIVISKNSDEVKVPIYFSASAINLSNYAKDKHIKEICSVLYINDKEVARVSGSKTIYVDKYINYIVSRNQYKSPTFYNINFKVKSYLYTEFSVDGLLENEIEKNVKLKVEPKEIIPLKEVSLKLLKKTNNKNRVVSPLVHNIYTDEAGSKGIIETQRHLALKLKLGVDFKDIQKIDYYINDVKTVGNLVIKNNKTQIVELNVDGGIQNTIKSWNYLRNKESNYFKVNFNEIGQRIKEPNILKIECTIDSAKYQSILKFDSIDSFDKNINYIFNNSVTNTSDINKEQFVEEWLNE